MNAPRPSAASPTDQAWLAEQIQRVRSEAFAALERHAQTPAQTELLGALLRNALARDGVEGGVCRVALQLPVLVHAAIRGEPDRAVHHLGAALTLLEAGIYALDHLLDDELDGVLAELPIRRVMLGAVCLISHLPCQVLVAIEAKPALTTALFRLFAEGLSRIGAGQLIDISEPGSSRSILTAVVMKTGERRALFAELAAVLASGTPSQVAAYAEFGRALGVARQLRSDLLDLYGSVRSRDLASGVRTLPLALYLESASPADAQTMESLLAAARKQADVQRSVCDRLREAGTMRGVMLLVEQHCRLALHQLESARPTRLPGLLLEDLVLAASFLKTGLGHG